MVESHHEAGILCIAVFIFQSCGVADIRTYGHPSQYRDGFPDHAVDDILIGYLVFCSYVENTDLKGWSAFKKCIFRCADLSVEEIRVSRWIKGVDADLHLNFFKR